MGILRSFFLVLAAAVLAGCAAPHASGGAPTVVAFVPLTVMSYNIRCGSCERPDDVNHWSRRKFLVSDLIRKSRADVIGLQEAELFQVRDLVSLLDGFDWVGVGRDDGAEKGEMNAVLVRRSAYAIASHKTLWLSDTPERVSRGWDAALNRTVTVLQLKSLSTGHDLYFLNAHFDHLGSQARDESARLIVQTVQALGEGVPVVLTGDFNARPGFAGYKTLSTRLQDAAVVSRTPPAGGSITFNGFGMDLQPGNKIDYVFVSLGQAVLSHKVFTDVVDGHYPSDHFPLVVDVGLMPASQSPAAKPK